MIETFAQLCLKSYDDNATGFVDVKDLRYGIFNTPFGRVICFRGTENLKNWLRDAKAFPVRTCRGYLAHAGFVRAFRDLCAGGMPTGVGEVDYAIGHSLGGSLATLYAEYTGCKVLTFGSPKVYTRLGSTPALDHVRVVIEDDPVQHLPGFLLYRHLEKAKVVKDTDWKIVDVSDHFMKHYAAMAPKLLSL